MWHIGGKQCIAMTTSEALPDMSRALIFEPTTGDWLVAALGGRLGVRKVGAFGKHAGSIVTLIGKTLKKCATLKVAKEQILLFMFITFILIYLSAVGIYFFENEAQPEHFSSIFDSLWWSIITLTTVGYGDVYPITVGGRVFTFCILLIGLGIVAIPTGIISAALMRSI
jgi:hypothetical protein